MGACNREVYNDKLMRIANYSNVTALKNLIINYKLLEDLASAGDGVAVSILIDLRIVLGIYPDSKSLLTVEQQKAVRMNLIEGYTQFEIAEILNVSQRTVSSLIKGGLKRAKQQLREGIYNVGEVDQ